MTTQKQIDALWNDLCEFIDSAYAKDSDANGALRDYLTKNGGWNHDLEHLLDRETENERRHRRGAWLLMLEEFVGQLIIAAPLADGVVEDLADGVLNGNWNTRV